jgi:hypothetical protein
MKKFNASNFYFLAIALEIVNNASGDPNEPVRPTRRSAVKKLLSDFNCDELGLKTSAVTIRRILRHLEEGKDITNAKLQELAKELQGRVNDELGMITVLSIEPDKDVLFESKIPFGEKVTASFPSTTYDIEEASKCLALNRGSASVFHLMRVMEFGLKALGKSLGDPTLEGKKNWGTILSRCRAELKKPKAERAKIWAEDEQFCREAIVRLNAVKDAWRNPTMHVEQSYDSERAYDVWYCVKIFISHLATKLSDEVQ